VRREVYFINCMKNVLTKSLLNDGFQTIKHASRDEHKSVVKSEVLDKFFFSVKKKVLSNALSVWRRGNYNQVIEVTRSTIRERNDREEKFSQLKDKLRTHNALKSENLIVRVFKLNVLAAWRNIARYLRVQRQTGQLCRAELVA